MTDSFELPVDTPIRFNRVEIARMLCLTGFFPEDVLRIIHGYMTVTDDEGIDGLGREPDLKNLRRTARLFDKCIRHYYRRLQ